MTVPNEDAGEPPGVEGPSPGDWDRSRAAYKGLRVADNSQPDAYNRQTATDNRPPAAYNRPPATDKRLPAAEERSFMMEE